MIRASIIIPAYNEEKRIGKTLQVYSEFFEKIKNKIDYIILVVINGTSDKTEEIVGLYHKQNLRIRSLNLSKAGKGFAITEGFKTALKEKFDFIGFVDADMATYPEEYWKLVERCDKYDGAIADRYAKGAKIINGSGFRRWIVSRIFNFLVRAFFLLPYKDTQCGAKVFKTNVIRKVLNELTITQWAYDVNLLYACKKQNFKIVSVPTVWHEAKGSKLNIKKASIQMLFSIIQLRILKSPLKNSLRIIKPIIDGVYKIVK